MIEDRVAARVSGDSRFVFRHEWTDAAAISPQMRVAVIASEDQKFPYHRGFDFDQIQTRSMKRRTASASAAQHDFTAGREESLPLAGPHFLRKGVEPISRS